MPRSSIKDEEQYQALRRKGESKEKAARIANAFANAYIEDQLQAKFEATHRASVWLEQRIGELRQQASDAYKEVQDFKSKNGIIIGVEGKLAS